MFPTRARADLHARSYVVVGCSPRRPRPRKPGQRKPLDVRALPRIVDVYQFRDPGPSEFVRWEESWTIEHQPSITFIRVQRREVRKRHGEATCATPHDLAASGGMDSNILDPLGAVHSDPTDMVHPARTLELQSLSELDHMPPVDLGPEIVVCPAPAQPFPGCKIGVTLMAHLVLSRVEWGCPTYLELKELELSGLKLPESTVRDAYARVDEVTAPLHPQFRAALEACHVVSTDDTRWLTLDRNAPGHRFKARFWAFIGDFDQTAYFDVTEDWKASSFFELLGNFRGGVLQGDGYPGYRTFVDAHPGVTEAGCLDHARRKVYDAYLFKEPEALWILERLQHVYRVESDARAAGVDLAELARRRQSISKQIMTEIYGFIESLGDELVRGSCLERAVTYFRNQRASLLAFLDDPRIPLSNAHVERLLKSVVLMRKNSLFSGSFEGAKRTARYKTIVANCRLAGIDPYHYLVDVLTRCGRGWPINRMSELMPRVWTPSTPRPRMPMMSTQTILH